MKRLYIGGLGHTVSEKDLKDRFGKFGDVSDVEIVTRKDENGTPLKTFGYININITDAEYKRCVGILNKSTWKGGTLLIQLAKESFLHRLAEERQQLVEKAKTPKIIPQEKLVDSFKAAGVENFHMKAAVPGTEIPGHKDWVVSKFGRVLPVVNLKGKGKNKVFKYDPSKHCHNIKRLETVDDVTSVSKLTWEIKGGDDEISKKRRGEFPKQNTCPKKSKIDLSLFLSNLAQRNGMNAAATGNKNKVAIQQNGLSAAKTGKQKSVRVFDNDSDTEDEIRMLVAQEHLKKPKRTSTEDDDDNLEVVGDDFVVKSNVVWGGVEQDDVKTSLLTSTKDDEEYDSADTDEILTRRKTQTQVESAPVTQDSPTGSSKNQSTSESDDGSDEADDDDTDDDVSVDSDYEAMMGNCYRLDLSLADLEQLAKTAEVISDDESVEEPKGEAKTPSAPPKKTGNNPEDILASLLGDDTPEKESKKKKNQVNTVSLPAFIGTKDLFGDPEPSLKRVAPNIDSESPKRLKHDLKLKEQSIPEDTQSSNRRSQQKLSTLNVQTASKKLANKASISKEDSSSQESESSDDEGVFTSKTSSASQSVIPETELKTVSSNNSKTPVKPNQTKTTRSSSSVSSSEESESSEEEDNEDSAGVLTSKTPSVAQSAKTISKTKLKTVSSNNSKTPVKPNQTKSSSSDSSSEESESSEEEDHAKVSISKRSSASQSVKSIPETELKTSKSSNSVKPRRSKTSRSSSSDSSSEESETSDDEKSRTPTKDSKSSSSKNVQENVVSHQTVLHPTLIDAKKQQQDNQKRLAALEQRQKESEQQRKLIQGALSNVDAAKVDKSKHIVFDSDDDDDDEEEEDKTTSRPEKPPTNLKKSLFEDDSGSDEDQQTSMSKEKKNNQPGGSKLFDSEDEDDGSEDERFQIKPQFEGKAGQKLMELQARFGTDSRFQVDSRFLESDGEPEDQDEVVPEKDAEHELLEEKNKSLDILQSILNTNIQPPNTRKGKMFKDVSSLHYDPTQEEHTAFEAKTEEPKKESKAARRKKRIEAEKLPEVSKDVYFDISVDLKEVFGTSKEIQEEKETVSWDKEEEDTGDLMKHMEVSFTSNVEANEDTSGGFKFSFFEEDTAAETTTKTDEYKIETVKGAKFSWQADPRFQDSSSDEEGVDEVEEDQSASNEINEEPTTSKKTFFFFYQNDERLKEGPGMFCRSVKLQDQRDAWEEKRTSLREECRKKHRDAKRRQRPSLKT
ncbi:nucleolar protein 8 [Carassius auratus]|uniref:Nucleolar protein 8 n=1 Tax=Carassius auratus TaxID=7957 RepID=A0A6P6J8W8_CARAU|nr:nucleolar protein 8-like [Carassius auratus]